MFFMYKFCYFFVFKIFFKYILFENDLVGVFLKIIYFNGFEVRKVKEIFLVK